MNSQTINVVHVLSQSEQVAFILTPGGGFIVTPIPDARRDTLNSVNILARKINSVDDAERWFRKEYA